MTILHITQENFEKEVQEAQLPVLIDFWAPWCGPCQLMGPVFEELSQEYEGKVIFAKLNTDEYGSLATPFGIQGIPSLLLLNNGKEVDRHVGFAPKDMLQQKINEMISKI